MKVVVGLGNPGKEYENTRHNVGFIILDEYLGSVSWKQDFNSLIHEENHNGEKIIFVKPQTFMNNSGDAIVQIMGYYNIDSSDLLVIQDDIALPLGKFRIKYESSDGGHNGIKSIINRLKTNSFYRLKIGLAKTENIDTISYVLGKISKQERDCINNDMKEYFNIIDKFIEGNLNR